MVGGRLSETTGRGPLNTEGATTMKGFIARTLAAACLAGVVAGGCFPYRNLVDPCHHDRYSYVARREVMDAFAPQVQNGHVLDQTVFNYHFDKGTDKLNPMGIQKLHEL